MSSRKLSGYNKRYDTDEIGHEQGRLFADYPQEGGNVPAGEPYTEGLREYISIDVPIDPANPYLGIYIHFVDVDRAAGVPWDWDPLCVCSEEITMKYDDWANYRKEFFDECGPGHLGPEEYDARGTCEFEVRGFSSPIP